jgi:hypothetical protein
MDELEKRVAVLEVYVEHLLKAKGFDNSPLLRKLLALNVEERLEGER